MGATLEQDLAINFLDALKNIWSERPGRYPVSEEVGNPLRALTQITIRWLAAMAREQVKGNNRTLEVKGRIVCGDANIQPTDAFSDQENVSLLEALNKIVHGEPQWVFVRDGEVILCWKYTPPWNSRKENDQPYSAYFLADSLFSGVRSALYSQADRRSQVSELERMIRTDPAYQVLLPGANG